MSIEDPTAEEIDAILQHEYGAYDVHLPAWYGLPAKHVAEVSEGFGKALDAHLDKIEAERYNRSRENPTYVITNPYRSQA